MSTILGEALWHEANNFWFNELSPKQWFISSEALDRTIKERFSDALEALTTQGQIPPVTKASLARCNIHNERDVLAAILITDQFSRNIHRGSSKAFATDPLALSLSEYLISSEALKHFSTVEVQFALMPYMHNETLEAQDTSVAMFTKFDIKLALASALEHQELIRRFGRFPHRNELLGRESTSEEKEYLKNGKKFGQG